MYSVTQRKPAIYIFSTRFAWRSRESASLANNAVVFDSLLYLSCSSATTRLKVLHETLP